jgi:flagellar basal-body rod modification protein FlgD
MSTTPVTTDPFAALQTPAKTVQTQNDAGSADRFLKLLVTQLQNQDPLNPMDNAQITSQMAQINTVNGIEKLNTSVSGLSTQFVQMQALQGAALVGHDITIAGNVLDLSDGKGTGGFELASTADAVKVEIMTPAGHVVDTLNLGAQAAGRHDFSWPAGSTAAGSDLRFKVTATLGTQAITSTALMTDKVSAVSTSGGGLVLRTEHSGDVAYSDVRAFN